MSHDYCTHDIGGIGYGAGDIAGVGYTCTSVDTVMDRVVYWWKSE